MENPAQPDTDREAARSPAAARDDADPVTGLPRLGADREGLAPLIDAARRDGERLLLLHVDLDEFSSISDNMGEDVANVTLAHVAGLLSQLAGGRGRVWRLSGDAFVIALAFSGNVPDLPRRIQDRLLAPLLVLPYTLQVSASIGYAVFPDDADRAAALLQRAETALHAAQADGLGEARRYQRERPGAAQVPRAARRVGDALPAEEFIVHYQPFVHANDGRIAGVEALLRWNSPELGLVGPSHFLELAERLGLIAGIGRWVFETVVGQMRLWRESGLDDLVVSINVSTSQLVLPGFVDDLESVLAQADVPPSALELELGEGTLTRNVPRIRDALSRLRDLDIRLTLDDFGIGGAGLTAIPRYPLDKIKIDRGFVNEVATDGGQAAIARAIIAMGRELQMKVMAEGVETEAQVAFLRRNRCDQLQGYLFAAPAPAELLGDLLRRRYLRPELFAATKSGQTLLLVDDEENVLRSLVRLFRREGYRILTASRVQEAFELLALNEVQVILSDQRMSDMSGTEFLGRVKELYPDTMRLVLSGYTDFATVTDAINRGAIYRFLTKPWDDDELRAHIREAFASHRKRA